MPLVHLLEVTLCVATLALRKRHVAAQSLAGGHGHGEPLGASCKLLRLFLTLGWIAVGLRRAVLAAGGSVRVAGGARTPCTGDALSFMRFLLYAEAGGWHEG